MPRYAKRQMFGSLSLSNIAHAARRMNDHKRGGETLRIAACKRIVRMSTWNRGELVVKLPTENGLDLTPLLLLWKGYIQSRDKLVAL
jgi:hypothetical protein